MKNIVFIAPPAAGKGTQSKLLVDNFNYTHISAGDLLRNPTTEEGINVQELMNLGELVSDELITKVIKDKLESLSTNFILDGYPRTIQQAEYFDEIIKSLNIDNIVIIYLDIDQKDAEKRMLGRIYCNNCNAIYNKYYDKMKPKIEGKCDICNSDLEVRTDDTKKAFNKRFQLFLDNTNQVLDYYKEKGLLKVVKVESEKLETFEKIIKCISGEEEFNDNH